MKFDINVREAKKFIIILYSVGVLGFLFEFSKNIFQYLTPFSLISTFILILKFHNAKFDFKTILVFTIVYTFTFGIELVGVQTGLVFGNYWYGNGLGFKIFSTPLLIGINWLFLAYISISISEKLVSQPFLKITFAATLMLFYDLLLELVADYLDMWYWSENTVPIQNYIMWFFLAFIIQLIFHFSKIDFKNPLSSLIYLVQILFLFSIYIIRVIFYA